MDSIVNQQLLAAIVNALLIPILPAIATYAITWLIAKKEALKEQIKNDNINKYVDMLDMSVYDVVNGLNQEIVEGMKAKTEDGKLTQEDIVEVKNMAVERVLHILGDNGLKVLKEVYGDIVKLIENKVEAEVNAAKLPRGK